MESLKWRYIMQEMDREDDRDVGRAEKTVTVITNMLKKHYSYAEIAEITETTEEEIIRIAEKKGLTYA